MNEIHFDEDDNALIIDGQVFYGEGDGCVEVPASLLRDTRLGELPRGIGIVLCDRIVGSRELTRRWPHCSFHVSEQGAFLANVEVAFFPDEEANDQERIDFFRRGVPAANAILKRMAPIVTRIDSSQLYDDIAYLSFSVALDDQLVLDAHQLIEDLENRLHRGSDNNLLFLCHATEDKHFVDKLANALDRRGMHAWYDKRELYVGDSIVEGVNRALHDAALVIAVISPRSVSKPWVARELNATLMRQLTDRQVCVLPALLERCELPPLLADIKYADFTESFDLGLSELLAGIRRFESRTDRE